MTDCIEAARLAALQTHFAECEADDAKDDDICFLLEQINRLQQERDDAARAQSFAEGARQLRERAALKLEALAQLSRDRAERHKAREEIRAWSSALTRDHLIVALDVHGLSDAERVVDQLGAMISHYKVGPHLFETGLITFIQKLVENDKEVFLDFKSVDIGETMRRMAGRVADLGVKFITVMGSTSTIVAAKQGREDRDFPKILAVTLLTDYNEDDMRREYGWEGSITEFVIKRARMAAGSGADGVICSPNEIRVVRDALMDEYPDFLIVTPGIRPIGVSNDDQKRVAAPGRAITDGADYLVVGRPIIRDLNNCVQNADVILREMQEAFDRR